jgi:serine-type D-Ala-D-Ala carboxypeptidase/endopeptidase (penicillin-binding protein 4)
MNQGLLTAFAVFFVTQISFATAPAAVVGSTCYVPLSEPNNIKGENIDVRLPIASVSKLITSYWAVKQKGIDYRFQTVFYMNKVGQNLYDLHIQGSRDPYFGAERLHFAISELNKRGITQIRNLTFDENFKFFWSIDDRKDNKHLASGFYVARDPVPEKVKSQLKAFPKLTQGYKETFDRAAKNGVKMVENPVFTVQSIEYQSLSDFKYDPVTMTNTYVVNSTPLANLLKEMNRNSNNHAANQIFEHLEAEGKFSSFLSQQLNLDMKSVVMLNGSGDRVDTADGAHYNEATCSSMLKILMDFHNTLIEQKSALSRVAIVIGTNDGTATGLYNSDKTFDSVIAKTGTVNPAVTLAGMASTEKGLVFFMFNMKTSGNSNSWRAGRTMIKKKLLELMSTFNGGVPLKAKAFSFISFDKESFSELQIPNTGEKLK